MYYWLIVYIVLDCTTQGAQSTVYSSIADII